MKKVNVQNIQKESGISLVELMIAVALGLILLLALTTIFVSNSRTRGEIEKKGLQIENGRYAMQTLVDDISNAGFFGGAEDGAVAEQKNYCNVANVNNALSKPYLDVIADGLDCVPDQKGNTGMVVLRRFSTNSEPDKPMCDPGVTCVQIDADGKPLYKTSEFTKTTLASGEVAPVYTPVTHIYYINNDNQLIRVSLNWAGGAATLDNNEVIADGIEQLAFNHAGERVRIELLARNSEGSLDYKDENTYTVGGEKITPADNIRRQFYSGTVSLRNRID